MSGRKKRGPRKRKPDMSQMVAAAGACIPGEANPNLISNGSFGSHIDGWFPSASGITLSYVGSGSRTGPGGVLSVNKATGAATTQFMPNGLPGISLGALTTIDAVAYVKSANTLASCTVVVSFFDTPYVNFVGDIGSETSIAVLAQAGSWSIVELRDIVVPVGATHAIFRINITDMDGTAVLVDDVYFGEPDLDIPPYSASPFVWATNLVLNGNVEAGLPPWGSFSDGDTTLETIAPLAGTKSIKFVSANLGDQEGIVQPSIAVPANTAMHLSFRAKGPADAQILVDHLQVSGQTTDQVWSGSFTETPTVYTADFTTPADSYGLYLDLVTEGQQQVTFWIDDVSLGTL